MASPAIGINVYSPASGPPVSATLDASGRYVQHVASSSPWITLIDDASATVSYYGFAMPGTATSSAVWRIMKKNVSGSVTSYLFANGSTDFSNIWDDRASLSYS